MAVKEDVINALAGALGTGEDPPGSNHNWITEWYADASGQDWARSGNPWCAMAVSWAMAQAGFNWFIYAYCPYIERDARNGFNGMSWGDTPRVGSPVLYDFEGSGMATHVGVVVDINSNGTFVTIEGNWGNAVVRLVRDMKYVRGFVYMPYDGPTDIPSPPSEQITGGHPYLRLGSKGASVRQIQTVCQSMGFDIGASGVDGDFGPATEYAVKQMQQRLECKEIDGIVGPETWEALDRLFAYLSAAQNQPPAPTPDGKLTIDGVLGPATISKLQEKIGVYVDGVLGTDTISKLQGYLGTPVDGVISRPRSQMVEELQRRVGANIDGSWGPDTTSHLQQALNDGSF